MATHSVKVAVPPHQVVGAPRPLVPHWILATSEGACHGIELALCCNVLAPDAWQHGIPDQLRDASLLVSSLALVRRRSQARQLVLQCIQACEIGQLLVGGVVDIEDLRRQLRRISNKAQSQPYQCWPLHFLEDPMEYTMGDP
jgi:hypothetical protein